jgi:predicted nucleotidyltransferase
MPSDGKNAEALRRLLERASEDPAVLAVLLFGSAARGEGTETSDVDVCVAFRRTVVQTLRRISG